MSTPIRAVNRARVLSALIGADTGFRPEIAQNLGLSLMSVTRIVRELKGVGLVREGPLARRSEPGRPARELSINPSAAYVLGFELHAFRQSMGVMDRLGRVVREVAFTLSAPTDGPLSLREIAEQTRAEIRAANIQTLRVMGAVVAMTGVVDREGGIVADAPYLGWSSLDVASTLRDLLDIPIIVDRIASILLAAEARKAPRVRDAFLVNVGFAMSAAFLVNGVIAYGDTLMAGQIGHLPSDDGKRICSCGQRGCLNMTASGWSALADLGWLDDLVQSAAEFQRYRPMLTQLLGLEKRGDAAAGAALRNAGRTLGRTVRSLQIALDPARIYLSGPVGLAPSYVEGVRQGIGSERAMLVAPCRFKDDEAAALMAVEEFVCSPQLDYARLCKANGRRSKAAYTTKLQ
jgi:predicted NBD/HSP70 family sugar kinase